MNRLGLWQKYCTNIAHFVLLQGERQRVQLSLKATWVWGKSWVKACFALKGLGRVGCTTTLYYISFWSEFFYLVFSLLPFAVACHLWWLFSLLCTHRGMSGYCEEQACNKCSLSHRVPQVSCGVGLQSETVWGLESFCRINKLMLSDKMARYTTLLSESMWHDQVFEQWRS